jgi:hypothetical protein
MTGLGRNNDRPAGIIITDLNRNNYKPVQEY